MVNLNELRRGNFVRDAVVNSRIIKVSEITPDHILHEGDESEEPFADDEIDGIPLTPEILEKCGFENPDILPDSFFGKETDFELNIKDGKFMAFILMGSTEVSVDIEIKHLHQLQNLYFALTGTELEINLTE